MGNEGDVTYKSGVEWILSLGKFGQKPGLSRVAYIMERLGNPQDKIDYIHIAGTNGKGSTSAYIASILEEDGYKVGLFTSPFMESFNERFMINGENIPDEDLEKLVDEVKPIALDDYLHEKYGHPTQFEIVTAIAFLYFSRENVDFVVLEVGLGGRLDATNIINPKISVITNISLEHTDVLGESIEEIAVEKAGIIKNEVPIITSIEDDKAIEVIVKKAFKNNSLIYKINDDFSFTYMVSNLKGQSFDYQGLDGSEIHSLEISLLGYHQLKNASLAVAVIETLNKTGCDITLKSIKEGLKKAKCPGRMEVFSEDPLVLLDASHNLEGIKCLSKEIRKNFSSEKDIILLLGILEDKEVEKMLSEILPLAVKVILTTPENPRAKDPHLLVEDAVKFIPRENLIVKENIKEATIEAIDNLQDKDMSRDKSLVCCGSFFVVSPVRNYLKKINTTFKFNQ